MLTRASALALLWLTGSWDPIVQMLFNALVHVAAIGLLIALLGRLLDLARFLLFAAFALLFFAVPFGWDNTLGGFQLQFYYLILLSVLSLHLALPRRPGAPRWVLGTLLAVLAYFAMASGALILPAAIGLVALQIAVGRRSGTRELAGLLLHAAIALALLHDALSFAPHGTASIGAAIASFLVSASWPIAAASWPSILKIIPAALINAPVLILGVRLLKERPGLDDRRWFALALAGWLALQLLALSYGRPGGTPESRYSDIFLIGVVLNAAAWLCLLRTAPSRGLSVVASVWLFAVDARSRAEGDEQRHRRNLRARPHRADPDREREEVRRRPATSLTLPASRSCTSRSPRPNDCATCCPIRSCARSSRRH